MYYIDIITLMLNLLYHNYTHLEIYKIFMICQISLSKVISSNIPTIVGGIFSRKIINIK